MCFVVVRKSDSDFDNSRRLARFFFLIRINAKSTNTSTCNGICTCTWPLWFVLSHKQSRTSNWRICTLSKEFEYHTKAFKIGRLRHLKIFFYTHKCWEGPDPDRKNSRLFMDINNFHTYLPYLFNSYVVIFLQILIL